MEKKGPHKTKIAIFSLIFLGEVRGPTLAPLRAPMLVPARCFVQIGPDFIT